MAFNLRNRNFLKLLDFTPVEIRFLLDLAAGLKMQNIREQSRKNSPGKILR